MLARLDQSLETHVASSPPHLSHRSACQGHQQVPALSESLIPASDRPRRGTQTASYHSGCRHTGTFPASTRSHQPQTHHCTHSPRVSALVTPRSASPPRSRDSTPCCKRSATAPGRLRQPNVLAAAAFYFCQPARQPSKSQARAPDRPLSQAPCWPVADECERGSRMAWKPGAEAKPELAYLAYVRQRVLVCWGRRQRHSPGELPVMAGVPWLDAVAGVALGRRGLDSLLLVVRFVLVIRAPCARGWCVCHSLRCLLTPPAAPLCSCEVAGRSVQRGQTLLSARFRCCTHTSLCGGAKLPETGDRSRAGDRSPPRVVQ